jgi:hypothetical protein
LPYVGTGYDNEYDDGDHAHAKGCLHAYSHEVDYGRTGYWNSRGEF